MTDHTPDPIDRRARALRYRNPELVLDLLGRLDLDPNGRHTDELLLDLEHTHDQTERTIRATLSDLRNLGAVTIVRADRDDETLRLSPLGRAWLRRDLSDLPLLTTTVEDDELSVRWTREETK